MENSAKEAISFASTISTHVTSPRAISSCFTSTHGMGIPWLLVSQKIPDQM